MTEVQAELYRIASFKGSCINSSVVDGSQQQFPIEVRLHFGKLGTQDSSVARLYANSISKRDEALSTGDPWSYDMSSSICSMKQAAGIRYPSRCYARNFDRSSRRDRRR